MHEAFSIPKRDKASLIPFRHIVRRQLVCRAIPLFAQLLAHEAQQLAGFRKLALHVVELALLLHRGIEAVRSRWKKRAAA